MPPSGAAERRVMPPSDVVGPQAPGRPLGRGDLGDLEGLTRWLDGDSFTLDAPALFLVLAAAVLAGCLLLARRRPWALEWTPYPEACRAGAATRDPVRGIGLALRAGAGLALAAALSGPALMVRVDPEPQQGLDMVLVIDASGSMRALDAEVDGSWRTRLDLAREVVARFAARRAAEGDRVGLVVFGERALTLCPLTRDGRLLEAALERLEVGVAGETTALGDALALAVKRVGGGSERPGDPPVAGRLVVLLTDGRANGGAVPTDLALALAASTGTRVHTVGIGSSGEVAMQSPSGRGRALRFERHDLDAETLARIAEATGGRAFLARSSADLGQVYLAIDGLERVPRSAPPLAPGEPRPEPFLAAAGVLVALELLLVRGLWRRLP